MQEILHSRLSDFIQKVSDDAFPSVCLVHGQEMLVAQSREAVVEKLLGKAQKDLSCESVDGLIENIPDLLELMNTFALLSGPKIVVFKDAKLFEARSGHQKIVDQIADGYAAQDIHRAAKSFLNLCGRLEIEIEAAVQRPKKAQPVNTLFGLIGSEGVNQLGQYCMDHGWSPAVSKDHVSALQRAIEKGFPENHYLIVTVNAKVPKNLKLYKLIRDHGVVIDCSVPMGERRADKMAQEAVLRQALDQQLADAGKRLPAGLFQNLCRLTGFDLRTFAHNVEKLIDYVGERGEITARDIDAVLQRTKIDPVFELTNALADRNHRQTLFFVNALLEADWHPLQILSALANQTRKLLVAKDFVHSQWGRVWTPGISYPQFQNSVMPSIQAFDRHNQEQALQWGGQESVSAKAGGGKKKASDVVLAPNPNNAYPVYQTLLKSEKYSLDEILAAMRLLNQSDLKLKSSGQDPGMVIKKMVSDICRPSRK